jgi:hypothetical protein
VVLLATEPLVQNVTSLVEDARNLSAFAGPGARPGRLPRSANGYTPSEAMERARDPERPLARDIDPEDATPEPGAEAPEPPEPDPDHVVESKGEDGDER